MLLRMVEDGIYRLSLIKLLSICSVFATIKHRGLSIVFPSNCAWAADPLEVGHLLRENIVIRDNNYLI